MRFVDPLCLAGSLENGLDRAVAEISARVFHCHKGRPDPRDHAEVLRGDKDGSAANNRKSESDRSLLSSPFVDKQRGIGFDSQRNGLSLARVKLPLEAGDPSLVMWRMNVQPLSVQELSRPSSLTGDLIENDWRDRDLAIERRDQRRMATACKARSAVRCRRRRAVDLLVELHGDFDVFP